MLNLGYEDVWYIQMSGKVGMANQIAVYCCYGVAAFLVFLYAFVATAVHGLIASPKG